MTENAGDADDDVCVRRNLCEPCGRAVFCHRAVESDNGVLPQLHDAGGFAVTRSIYFWLA